MMIIACQLIIYDVYKYMIILIQLISAEIYDNRVLAEIYINI